MSVSVLPRIGELIRRQCDVLLARWRREVRRLPSAKRLDVPALNDHVPRLIEELAAALDSRSEDAIEEAMLSGSPPEHGRQRLHDGFDIGEVVGEYNALRACVHDLAEENGVAITGPDLRILNRLIDEAIGLALQSYATQLALEVKERRDEHLTFVAHDLRAPLQAIAVSAHAIAKMIPKEARNSHIEQLLKILRRNIRQLESLVANVIKENAAEPLEAGDKLQRREIDLWPLVLEVINGFEPVAATASVRLVNNVPGDLCVFADAGLLTRVFENLIAHSIEYAPRATVLVDAKERLEDGVVDCIVSDNGAGLAQESIATILADGNAEDEPEDRFGLATAKQLIEAHGGSLTAENAGGGTTFRFTLPASPHLK